jgi:hypothetical protein
MEYLRQLVIVNLSLIIELEYRVPAIKDHNTLELEFNTLVAELDCLVSKIPTRYADLFCPLFGIPILSINNLWILIDPLAKAHY